MNITINFFEVALSKDQITVPYLSFKGKEQVKSLRNNYPEAIFLRSRDKLFFWGTNSFSAEGTENIDKAKDRNLFSNILAHSLLQQFYQPASEIRIRKDFHVYQVTFFDNDISANKYRGIKLYKTFHVHFTPFLTNAGITTGFTVSTSITGRISWTIHDFETEGIPYDDLWHDEETGRIFMNSKALYRLAHHLNYASQIKEELDRQNAVQNEFREINLFVETYFKSNLNNFILPDGIQVETINGITYDMENQKEDVNIQVLSEPECYFYRGAYPRSPNTFHKRRKIGYNKPFSYDEFENRTINISIIYPKNLYQDVRMFFKFVQQELISTLKLRKDNFDYTRLEIEDFTLKSYQKILSSVKSADLVVVVVDKAHEALKPNESPYYFCKSEFIKRGINTQEVQIQPIQQFLSDKNRQKPNYTDHNIALNIYAKLGGMAWTIKPSHRRNELVVGIGATTDKEGQPILGLTSIFRGDGKYLLGKASSVTNMSDYKDKLEQVISSTIESSIQDGTLDTDKVFYLIFHIFKPAGKNNEIEALKRVVDKFSGYSFEHAFIHIGKGHNYRFFMYEGNHQNPKFTIKRRHFGQNLRGTLVEVNQKRGFLGLQPNSSVFYKIDIHKESSFIDLEYIAEQVYQFAEMSHKSYNTQGIPVTIKYPNLMAGFVEKFNEGNLMYLDEVAMPDHSLWFI